MSKEELGKCPKCKSENLDWGDKDFESDSMSFDVWCNDCDWSGVEVYEMKFQGYYESLTGELA